MSKITLLVLGGCLLFGLLHMVTSEKSAAPQEDAEGIQDDSERIAPKEKSAPNDVYRPRPNQLIMPQKNQLQQNIVDCYSCTDCPKILANTTSKICPWSLNPSAGCVVYAEKYKHMSKPWYIRGCSSERGTCADIIRSHVAQNDIVSLLFCEECEGDRCNVNGAHSIGEFSIMFLVLVATPLIGKFTLS